MRNFLSGIALTLLTGLLIGCAHQQAGEGGRTGKPGEPNARLVSDRYEVTVTRTPLYFYGPSQPKGPDLGLPKGMKVTMVKPDRMFSQVRTDQGHTGYVSTEDLKQLPPEVVMPAFPGLVEAELPTFYHNIPRQPLPEMEIVPLDLMLAEPPLPSSDGKPTPSPTPAASTSSTSSTADPIIPEAVTPPPVAETTATPEPSTP